MRKLFIDRIEAGRELGRQIAREYGGRDVIVLGLPRGGVPVAYEVAQALRAPLDVFVVRKLGAPFNPEFAIGAIASGGVRIYNRDALARMALDESDVERIAAREGAELRRREQRYRAGRKPLDLSGKTAILVDDGIATGATMEAAVKAARALRPKQIVVAAPTAARDAVDVLRQLADDVVVLRVPEPYMAVGVWYERFPQLRDEEVTEWLETPPAPRG